MNEMPNSTPTPGGSPTPVSPQTVISTPLKNWRDNPTNKILFYLVLATVAVYVLYAVSALFIKLVGDDGTAGLLILPLVFIAWLLTPVGLISLLMLAIRTKKAMFIIISIAAFLGVVGFYAYDILVVAQRPDY